MDLVAKRAYLKRSRLGLCQIEAICTAI